MPYFKGFNYQYIDINHYHLLINHKNFPIFILNISSIMTANYLYFDFNLLNILQLFEQSPNLLS